MKPHPVVKAIQKALRPAHADLARQFNPFSLMQSFRFGFETAHYLIERVDHSDDFVMRPDVLNKFLRFERDAAAREAFTRFESVREQLRVTAP